MLRFSEKKVNMITQVSGYIILVKMVYGQREREGECACVCVYRHNCWCCPTPVSPDICSLLQGFSPILRRTKEEREKLTSAGVTRESAAFTTNGSTFQTKVTFLPSSSGLLGVLSHLTFLFLLTDIHLIWVQKCFQRWVNVTILTCSSSQISWLYWD